MSKFHGLIDGDIILYECIAGKDDEVLADLCYSISSRVRTLREDCGIDTYDIFLSGPREVNYRYEVYPEYKAKRPPKPAHLEGARQYMFDKLSAIEGSIGENDDQIGRAGMKAFADAYGRWVDADAEDAEEMKWYSTTVIMTTDKDLKMIPGWHYSWSPNSDHDWHWVTLDQGFEWFFTQLLTGDNTDGIPGLKGVGPKAAKKVMAVSENNKERLINVVEKYVSKGQTLDYMLAMADLLWIQRDDRRGSDFITQLATQSGVDLYRAFPQPEPEPEPESKEEPEPSTKQEAKPKSSVEAFANRRPGKIAAAFAKKSETLEEKEKQAKVLVQVVADMAEQIIEEGSSEEDLKAGIEGPVEAFDKAVDEQEPLIDHDPEVTTYPDDTTFDFDDDIPF